MSNYQPKTVPRIKLVYLMLLAELNGSYRQNNLFAIILKCGSAIKYKFQ